jgi:predicted enzyme related to lactoylglutathione lyase
VAILFSKPNEEKGIRMIKGIDVVYIHSFNKELADWYEKTLGIKKTDQYPGWQEFAMPTGSRFGIDFISYPSSTVQRQPVVISFLVDDIHKAVDELAKKGVRFYPDNDTSKTIFDVGPTLIATFEDPEGNFVQLSQQKRD